MKTKFILKQIILFFFFSSLFIPHVKADRVYVLPGTGYNQADPSITNAIAANGHTVVIASSSTTTLPAGFTSTYIDPINGYDWLCIFGEVNYSGIMTQVKTFIDDGGKVYYQYEVTCCITSSSGAASFAASFTGLPIVPNANPYIAIGQAPAWVAANIDSCVSIYGNAYKGMDGVPLANQIRATSDLNGGSPSYAICPNFGMFFSKSDFVGTSHKGGFVAFGDVNLWFDGHEPPNNGGSTPVDMNVINYVFPNDTSTCYLFPPGPIINTGINALEQENNLISAFYNSQNNQLEIRFNSILHFDIRVYNAIGQQVYFSKVQNNAIHTVNTKSLARGIYFVKIFSGKNEYSRKVLIN